VQLLKADDQEGIAAIMKAAAEAFKAVLVDVNAAGLLLSQLNNVGVAASTDGKPFSLTWLYGGGFLDMLADGTWYIHRDLELSPEVLGLDIFKDRNYGGGGKSVELAFDGPKLRVMDKDDAVVAAMFSDDDPPASPNPRSGADPWRNHTTRS
jgi:hypothetical protein